MSIITKRGDQGKTSLSGGERIWKDNQRVIAYGTVDELDTFISDAKHLITNKNYVQLLEDIQKILSRMMGELATKNKAYPEPITAEEVKKLNEQVQALEEQTPLNGFVIPGSLPVSARLDICRTVARRAEREIVALARKERVSREILQYINRLSDLLFMLARTLEEEAGAIKYLKPNK
ncbi:MAG: cob(I)yrinic acid a,c-diamide adenosyltransferase [Candidatus Cloacimonadaceae bacterium]|jgi:ATP:cob(I)alamin adenosyltransferase|nr:cob(I)yrinic acid a,c-diamide adenosyltransferase [Candidatus Cloacimonadota bacterium]MCB5257971.1 cob(I)yrinic acid a,c-diamide adenosyltransferase [Candidatus Cloacimonadota bacterium]MDD5625183.1 cob(I)yrinic acid a,c-diamide adenosyltransferase [Candidatus Cloacimonadota bacterium]MDY0112425.1 cob(I)yrinic acid a,c-diamide adenosyltransferase [Candidatus Syntrophosphaera sp.]